MGVVLRAEDVRLKRPVALKFLPTDLSASADVRARFLREAQAAAALDSPYICTVYEAGECDGTAYIAMAFIDGPTLRQRMTAGPLSVEDAITFARHMAEGLAEAHRKHVIHRDIKPANVMLAENRQARITDFGLARIQGSGETTMTGGVVGTLAYMSPEQAQGQRTDARTDIWSVGCVIYEMLAGQRPFAGQAGDADVYAILHSAPRPLAALRPDVPPQLAAIVERCLQKDCSRRYADGASLLSDLNAIAAGPPHLASAVARDAPPSIAVLPFVDMSPQKDQEYFAEGIAEELIHALARIQDLRVVARTSAFAFAGKNVDVREIGRTLNVGAVLEGSVRKAGNRLRVTAQLISVADGFHLWSERFDREAGDIFAIQDELSLAIVEHLKVSLHVSEKAALQKRATADTEAYNLYLKGLYFLARPRPDLLERARCLFEEALARDPRFAKAQAGIASVHSWLGNLNFAPPNEAWPKAKAAIEKALALDENLPEAHALAASAAFWYDWDWEAAGRSFNRILSLNPGDALTHGAYAWYCLNRRRFDDSLREIKLALALDPLMPLFYAWSIGLHSATGHPDEALADFARGVEIDPTFGLQYFHAASAYAQKGMTAKAIETLEAGSRIAAHPGWGESMLALIHVKRGDRERAERTLREAISRKGEENIACIPIAWALASLGHTDEAFEWFERGVVERDTLVGFVHIYTERFVPQLVHDARFRALLARLNLTDVAGV